MDFKSIQKKAKTKWDNLVNSKQPIIYYGAASCGRAAGSLASKKVIEETLKKIKIKAKLVEVGCIGPCCYEPLIYIKKPGSILKNIPLVMIIILIYSFLILMWRIIHLAVNNLG